jgi:hypothetical protein
VTRPAEYKVSVRFAPVKTAGVVRVSLNGATLEREIAEGASECVVGSVRVPAGEGRLEAQVESGGATVGVHYVTVET